MGGVMWPAACPSQGLDIVAIAARWPFARLETGPKTASTTASAIRPGFWAGAPCFNGAGRERTAAERVLQPFVQPGCQPPGCGAGGPVSISNGLGWSPDKRTRGNFVVDFYPIRRGMDPTIMTMPPARSGAAEKSV